MSRYLYRIYVLMSAPCPCPCRATPRSRGGSCPRPSSAPGWAGPAPPRRPAAAPARAHRSRVCNLLMARVRHSWTPVWRLVTSCRVSCGPSTWPPVHPSHTSSHPSPASSGPAPSTWIQLSSWNQQTRCQFLQNIIFREGNHEPFSLLTLPTGVFSLLKLPTVGADKNGTPVFVHFSAQAASNSNISEAIM